MSKEALETAVGLAPYPGRVLLTGLAALGLIVKDGASYRNSALAESLLVQGKPDSIAPCWAGRPTLSTPACRISSIRCAQGKTSPLRQFPGKGDTLYQRPG